MLLLGDVSRRMLLLLVLVLKLLLVDSSCYRPFLHQPVNSVCATVLLLTSMAASSQLVYSHDIVCDHHARGICRSLVASAD